VWGTETSEPVAGSYERAHGWKEGDSEQRPCRLFSRKQRMGLRTRCRGDGGETGRESVGRQSHRPTLGHDHEPIRQPEGRAWGLIHKSWIETAFRSVYRMTRGLKGPTCKSS
jgi:hypothetical protein